MEVSTNSPTEYLGRCSKRPRRTLDWLELPGDVTVLIFRRLDQAEILSSVQFVCSTWLHICRDPRIWKSINLRCPVSVRDYKFFISSPEEDSRRIFYRSLCFKAFHYTSHNLSEISIDCFANDRLLLHISARFSQLKCLRLRHCFRVSNNALCAAVAKLPLLEEIEFLRANFSHEVFKVIARCCPNLKTLKYNCQTLAFSGGKLDTGDQFKVNKHALSIALNFPRLRHLELICNPLDDDALRVILARCSQLESLDLLFCMYLDMRGDLRERCFQQFKYLRLPLDGVEDEVNQIYRPPFPGILNYYDLHTLRQRLPLLFSS